MAPPIGSYDPLFEFELSIARRADEIARARPTGGSAKRDRETWTRAEDEVLTASLAGCRTTRCQLSRV